MRHVKLGLEAPCARLHVKLGLEAPCTRLHVKLGLEVPCTRLVSEDLRVTKYTAYRLIQARHTNVRPTDVKLLIVSVCFFESRPEGRYLCEAGVLAQTKNQTERIFIPISPQCIPPNPSHVAEQLRAGTTDCSRNKGYEPNAADDVGTHSGDVSALQPTCF